MPGSPSHFSDLSGEQLDRVKSLLILPLQAVVAAQIAESNAGVERRICELSTKLDAHMLQSLREEGDSQRRLQDHEKRLRAVERYQGKVALAYMAIGSAACAAIEWLRERFSVGHGH